jgi:heme-degrading monooxygenase HmoA
MAVLIRNRAEGMTTAAYAEIAPPLVAKVKTQPGFIIHVAFVDGDGRFTVSEIWETQEQHARWFDENVKPNLPDGIVVEHEVLDVHAIHTP